MLKSILQFTPLVREMSKVFVQLIRTEEEMYRVFGCMNFPHMKNDITLPFDLFKTKFHNIFPKAIIDDMRLLFNKTKVRKVIHWVKCKKAPTLGFEVNGIRYRFWNGIEFGNVADLHDMLPFELFKLEY
jgi:hypothetical protein